MTQGQRYSYEDIASEAKKYATKTMFSKRSPSHYKAGWRRGVLDEVCTHMKDQRTRWSLEQVAEAASKYRTRSEFQKEDPNAYDAARRLRVMDKVCAHMTKRGHSEADMVYLLKVKDSDIFKIGRTSHYRREARYRELEVLHKVELDEVMAVRLQGKGSASVLEQSLLRAGSFVDHLPGTEFRELDASQLERVMKRIAKALIKNHGLT